MNKIFLIAIIISLYIGGGSVNAQETPPINESVEIEIIKTEYEKLREQNSELMQSVQREREQHYKFIEGVYNQVRNVFIVIIAVAGFLGWKTFKDIRNDAKALAKDSYKRTIEENSTGLSNSLQKINSIVERETVFRSQKIGFIYESAISGNIQEMINILNEREFKNVFLMKIEAKTDRNKLNANTFDVFVYFLEDFKKEKKLIKDKVVSAISGTDKPLIIYTNHDNSIDRKEMEELIAIHKWILPSNNRISLLNSIFSVSNLFS